MIRYRRADHIAWRRVGDETILVHLGRKRMLALDVLGGLVWDALAQQRDAAELARSLPATANEAERRGVEAFLQDLRREGVVEVDPPSSAPAGDELPGGAPAAPAITWREPIQQFASGGCGTNYGQGGPCQYQPTTS